MPAPLRKLFALFPLHVYPGQSVTSRPASPTLWIHSPNLSTSPRLSRDVECLKWQAYLALRGITNISLRWDISPDGGINGALPALHLPTGDLLGPTRIPAWVDSVLRSPLDELEGYRDEQSRDESRAWIALLEGVVHNALAVSIPHHFSIKNFLDTPNIVDLVALFQRQLPLLPGLRAPIPIWGRSTPSVTTLIRYRDAIQSVSDRLGDDEWFLGSSAPTALDALVFAYLHVALGGSKQLREEVLNRPNLVSWRRKVSELIDPAPLPS
ncbi:hypothetical protein BS47DRAFT_1371092 [Hydnum rufescens UP504]|uniref:Metaxin glutathione S-transferase domain-containing protein n=1 Tax=Hydnum rufescens UP504 TaxID=1448309 RepID=A0A9P6B6C1_9AGAM|nr:hypothetical protein BS47DRAFT_1371092 [Hydnum rufescens UP504]